MTYLDIVTSQLRIDEGTRSKPYKDQCGNLTIGVGRNLTANGLSEDEIEYLLKNDVGHAAVEAATLFEFTDEISDDRKAVLVNMMFNMGEATLSTFHGLIAAVAARDWNAAADHMIASKWASQVGPRAQRLADKMRGTT